MEANVSEEKKYKIQRIETTYKRVLLYIYTNFF